MGITKGLAAIQSKTENTGSGVRWLKIPDGSSYRIRFLDDLDESSDTTLHGAGTAVMLEEHVSPKDFRRKALCTKDEGRCWACEMAMKHPKTGWARRSRVYVNVLVNDGTEDPYVAIWSMGIAKSPVFETLKDVFIEEGSISNREWRIKRSGAGTNTTYTMRDAGVDKEPFDFNEFERVDFDKVSRHVPYEDQSAHYLGLEEEEAVEVSTEEW